MTVSLPTMPLRNQGLRHRMPWGFGPTTGPRMHTDGTAYDYSLAPRTSSAVSFLTDAGALQALLPPGFTLNGEPVVTVEATCLTELPWLAGRDYSMLGVRFNAEFRGARDVAVGPFLAVLWENRPEPIISGREELGFAKVFCDLPPERVLQGTRHNMASWEGHTFMRMRVGNLVDAVAPTQATASTGSPHTGMLHYRYLPKVSAPGEAEVAQAVLTPAGGYTTHYDTFQRGEGAVEFIPSTWEQIPTMFHIVNTLAALPQREARGATFVRSRGAKDLSDQRPLF